MVELGLQLKRQDSVVVARMQKRNIFTGAQPSLQLEPAGIDLIDLIVITWVYEEKKAHDRRNNNAAIASSSNNTALAAANNANAMAIAAASSPSPPSC